MSATALSFEAFAQRLLQLLDEGRFVATYKYAVLLGLLDVLVESVDERGRAPAAVSTRRLAAKVVELYWTHTLSYDDHPAPLRQNQQGQAQIVSLIIRFREKTIGDATLPVGRARLKRPQDFERLVRAVEWKLIEMPLGKLQRVGDHSEPFIYTPSWGGVLKQSDVKADAFNGHLVFARGAGDHLLTSEPLLRPLVRAAWTSVVARINHLPQADLQDFLSAASASHWRQSAPDCANSPTAAASTAAAPSRAQATSTTSSPGRGTSTTACTT